MNKGYIHKCQVQDISNVLDFYHLRTSFSPVLWVVLQFANMFNVANDKNIIPTYEF